MSKEKILITGGTGFIGANFVRKFLESGNEVNLIVRPQSNFWRIEEVRNKVKLHFVDLTKAEEVENFVSNLKPQIILHFATYGAYQGKQQDIKTTLDTNILGTINLVNACSKINFKCFINTSSSSEYGLKEKPMREDNLLEPNNLYGITKAAATMYSQFLAKKMDLPLITMRLFSPFGYFEDKGRLVPALIKSYLTDSTPNISSASAVRDFIFIEDVENAYLKAIKKIDDIKGNIFNIGSGTQHSLDEAANMVKKIIGSKIEPNYGTIKNVQYEPKKWVADISKAKKLLNWKPEFSLEEGLSKTINWFKGNLSLYN